MSLRYLERLTAREPVGALVFMHGRGGLEADVFPFVDGLGPKRRHWIEPDVIPAVATFLAPVIHGWPRAASSR